MRRFMVLLRKELRELLTLQMLIPLLVVVVIFTLIGDVIGAEQEKAEASRAIAVLDLDASPTSVAVVGALEEGGFEIIEFEPGEGDIEDAVGESPESMTLIIPDGFEESIGGGDTAPIVTYTRVESFSLSGIVNAASVKGVVAAVNGFVSDQLLAEAAPGADPLRLKQPIQLEEHVMVAGASMLGSPETVEGFVIQQSIFVPMILFFVIMMSAQMIATTVASEKENKTLETLLAAPISRGALVTSKMLAAGIVAGAAAVAYMWAMSRYLGGVSGGMVSAEAGANVMAELGLELSTTDYLLVGLTLFLAILIALSIALILGAFADSVRSVGAIMAPLMVMLIVPYLLVVLLDFTSLSPALRTLVMVMPFTYAFIAIPSLMLGDQNIVYWGIFYQAGWFVVFAWIAARIFSSDRILTMRLRWSRRRS